MRFACVCLACVHLLIAASGPASAEGTPVVQAGLAKIDVTPTGPIQLINVKEPVESTSISERLFARALTLGDGTRSVILISFDGIGVPASLADRLKRRLSAVRGIPPENVALCATHTHWAPHLTELLPNIYGGPLPAGPQQRIDDYTERLAERLERVALEALDASRPSRVSWACGRVTFATNRRLEPGGQLLRDENARLMVTWNPQGPVDHSLPVLVVHDAQTDALTGIHFTYACHNVALASSPISGFVNSVHGDWAGLAQNEIERRHPGSIAICSISCGGDQRPNFCGGIDVAAAHAREISQEIDRLLDAEDWRPVSGPIAARVVNTELPLEPMPSSSELESMAQHSQLSASGTARAVVALQRLRQREEGVAVPKGVPFLVQSWKFHDGPTFLFLSGEVCIDYQIRIKREYGELIWPIAYANATPCYIVSRRMLQQGGYEAGNSMFYYGWLRPLQPTAEEVVMDAVGAILRCR